jgi:uncharacterized surface protein with fasciclin (FAS1) repeats
VCPLSVGSSDASSEEISHDLVNRHTVERSQTTLPSLPYSTHRLSSAREFIMFRFSLSSMLLVSLSLSSSVTSAQNLPTLAQFLGNDTELSTLSAALSSSGYNISSLNTSTFFAPTNAAFDELDATLLTKLLKPGWSKHLENVLLMHITTLGALDSSQLTNGEQIFTLNTESLNVSIDNGNISISSPNTQKSVVVQADIDVVEGIVHKVDQVLLPKFVNTSLLDLAGGEGYSILTELLILSGLSNVVGSDVIATVFAPTDDAFKALKNGTLEYYRKNVDVVTSLLAGHVITNIVLPTSDMVDGQIPNKTAGGTYLTVTIDESAGTKVYMIDNATISTPNVLANNGIIHGISSVLAVPGTEYPPVSKPSAPSAPSAPTAKPPTTPTSDAIVHGSVVAFVMAFLGVLAMA